jgi:hypothetical protein
MLAHLVLGDMAKTADEPKVAMKPHMVFVSSDAHYDAEFVQKDVEKILETLNDPFSYPNKDERPYELYKLAKCKSAALTPGTEWVTSDAQPSSIHYLHRQRASFVAGGDQCQHQCMLSGLL